MTTTTMGSVELRDSIAGYAQHYVERSGEVSPVTGTQANPGEEVSIHLIATNDPNAGVLGADHVGVRLVNVRWHVHSLNSTVTIIVPNAPLDARAGSTENDPLLTPGDRVSELYLFPRYGKKVLDPGETDSIELRGFAESAGTILVMFDVVADVDDAWLDLKDQTVFPLACLGTSSVVT